MGIGWRRHGRGVGAHGSRLGISGVCATAIGGKPPPTFDRVPTLECKRMWEGRCDDSTCPDEALNRAANQPASNQTPVAAEAAPATRTNGAAAVGSQRTTA